jgi:hypothetical protein
MRYRIIFLSLGGLLAVFFILNSKIQDQADLAQNQKQAVKTKIIDDEVVEVVIPEDKLHEHAMMPVDCKTCHSCDYPTKNSPCLSPCPRNELITVYHSPDEGPTLLHLDDLTGELGEVTFSHKIHAQMSEISGGCESCHHYNTTGPVLKCKSCHSESRIRDNLDIPDLEAAYHRQCVTCHRQWSRSTDCQGCHIEKGLDIDSVNAIKLQRYKDLNHPEIEEPARILYETNYNKGRVVTFFHDEHTNLYGQACSDCHGNDNCIDCHDVQITSYKEKGLKHKKHKTFAEHHNPCSDCHETEAKTSCIKCHQDKPMQPFNHLEKTGFDLSGNHAGLTCGKCHGEMKQFTGLSKNCNSCHKEFLSGNFDHSRAGVALDDMHGFLECGDCHKGNNFAKAPDCSDCHDGYKFPGKVPGKIIKKK